MSRHSGCGRQRVVDGARHGGGAPRLRCCDDRVPRRGPTELLEEAWGVLEVATSRADVVVAVIFLAGGV